MGAPSHVQLHVVPNRLARNPDASRWPTRIAACPSRNGGPESTGLQPEFSRHERQNARKSIEKNIVSCQVTE